MIPVQWAVVLSPLMAAGSFIAELSPYGTRSNATVLKPTPTYEKPYSLLTPPTCPTQPAKPLRKETERDWQKCVSQITVSAADRGKIDATVLLCWVWGRRGGLITHNNVMNVNMTVPCQAGRKWWVAARRCNQAKLRIAWSFCFFSWNQSNLIPAGVTVASCFISGAVLHGLLISLWLAGLEF